MEPLPITDSISIPGWEMWFTVSRAGGAGGQHINKTSTRVSLHWTLSRTTAFSEDERARLIRRLAHRLDQEGVLVLNVEDTRSQHRNKEAARERLAALLVEAIKRPRKRRPTRPSMGAKRRRADAKTRKGNVKRLRQRPREDD